MTNSCEGPGKKVIIVSGATSGIGLATLRKLCEQGWIVAGFGRSSEKVRALLPELQSEFGVDGVILQALDICDLEELTQFVDMVLGRYGRVDGLVNGAGILELQRSHKVSLESFSRQVETMLQGAFFLTQAVLSPMLKQGEGLVINFGSVVGQRPAPQMAIYGAVKAAVQHLTSSLAAEYAGKNLRFVCINPGPVETSLMDKFMYSLMQKKVPLGRLGKPEEVADLVVFLFSESARFMTGSTITIDGGAAL